jgi:hypothetical protein
MEMPIPPLAPIIATDFGEDTIMGSCGARSYKNVGCLGVDYQAFALKNGQNLKRVNGSLSIKEPNMNWRH